MNRGRERAFQRASDCAISKIKLLTPEAAAHCRRQTSVCNPPSSGPKGERLGAGTGASGDRRVGDFTAVLLVAQFEERLKWN